MALAYRPERQVSFGEQMTDRVRFCHGCRAISSGGIRWPAAAESDGAEE
jgi:hypothetical protein